MSGDRSNKSKQAAAYLRSHGYPHGRRMSSPVKNSGGLNMSQGPGSSKYQRLLEKKGRK